MARFEVAENDAQRLEFEIREREAQIEHDVQLMSQVIMFIDQLSSPFGFLSKAVKAT